MSDEFRQYCRNRGHGERFIRFCEVVREVSTNDEIIAITLANQTSILRDKGKLDEALALHKQELEIHKRRGNKQGIAASYLNQGVILRMQQNGKRDDALQLYKKQQKICEQLGSQPSLATCLWNMSGVFISSKDFTQAVDLCEQAI